MNKIGLVLEGGGQRVLHSIGILDYFLEKEMVIPYVIGVSAGASIALSYISNQIGRNKKVHLEFAQDKRYLSISNLIFKGSIFGMDFIFNKIPNELVPFDYDSYFTSPIEQVIGVTNCFNGESEYFYKSENVSPKKIMDIIIASCSIPYFSKRKFLDGINIPYVDGGLSDPLPISKAIEDGCKKNVIILTRNMGYRKPAFKKYKYIKLFFRSYRKYAKIEKRINDRHEAYNKSLEIIEKLEKEGSAFVLRPQTPVKVSKKTKDVELLTDFYFEGYNYAKEIYPELLKWIELE